MTTTPSGLMPASTPTSAPMAGRALALDASDDGAAGRVRRAHELLAHTPRNAHHGDFHQETSTSNEGSAPRYSNTPGRAGKARPANSRRCCTAKPLAAAPREGEPGRTCLGVFLESGRARQAVGLSQPAARSVPGEGDLLQLGAPEALEAHADRTSAAPPVKVRSRHVVGQRPHDQPAAERPSR